MKKLLTNQFLWYCIMAVFEICLTVCYIYEGKDILAILWAVCAGCNIAMAWLRRKDN